MTFEIVLLSSLYTFLYIPSILILSMKSTFFRSILPPYFTLWYWPKIHSVLPFFLFPLVLSSSLPVFILLDFNSLPFFFSLFLPSTFSFFLYSFRVLSSFFLTFLHFLSVLCIRKTGAFCPEAPYLYKSSVAANALALPSL